MNDAAHLALRDFLRDNVAPQHPLALELAAAWACVVADVAGDLPARVDGAALHLADVALPLPELADVIRPSLLGAEGAIRYYVTCALLSARYQKRVTWRRADGGSADGVARIYTGPEALALRSGATPGPWMRDGLYVRNSPREPPILRALDDEGDGCGESQVRHNAALAAAAPDLAASVAHHDARAEKADAWAAQHAVALRVVALWLGGPHQSSHPDDVASLARAKGAEFDALRAAAREMLAAEEAYDEATRADGAEHTDAGRAAAVAARRRAHAADTALRTLLAAEAPRG
jgi:hypothetical protein